MSDSTVPSSSEWTPYYQESISRQALPPGGILDATTSVIADNMLSPNSPSSTAGGQLNTRGSVSKPVRRRSRASKRTPTTRLNANATNFRALVQQFTGCSSTTTAPSSFGPKRGPLNLNFGLASQQHVLDTTSMMASFGIGYNNYNRQTQPQPQPQTQTQTQQHPKQEEHRQQEQQYMFSLNNNATEHALLSEFSNPGPNMRTLDNSVLENISSLHELIGDSFSYGNNASDHGCFY